MKRFYLSALPVLLAFALLPAAAPPADISAEVARLIRQLGDDDFDQREAASRGLSRIGGPALASLRRAERDTDLEVRRRASKLAREIQDRLDRTDHPSEQPPKGAVVLFGGEDLDAWEGRGGKERPGWNLLKGGAMEAAEGDLVSRRCFGGRFRLHLEFRVPGMPQAKGQARGNSGVYVQGRYEVQILDSFGLAPDRSSCAAVYGLVAPRANACKAPLTWQSFDADFTAPAYEGDRKVKDARLSLWHNGVKVHDDVSLPGPTAGGLPGDPSQPGPVLLQYHSCAMRFRNVWLLPLAPRRD